MRYRRRCGAGRRLGAAALRGWAHSTQRAARADAAARSLPLPAPNCLLPVYSHPCSKDKAELKRDYSDLKREAEEAQRRAGCAPRHD